MKYTELKQEIDKMELENRLKSFNGFEESLEFEHFNTVFEMKDAPQYTLMQFKDSEEFNTSSETWVLCLPKDGQMFVMDMGTEDEVCNQFFNLIEILSYGFGTAEIRPKDDDNNSIHIA